MKKKTEELLNEMVKQLKNKEDSRLLHPLWQTKSRALV